MSDVQVVGSVVQSAFIWVTYEKPSSLYSVFMGEAAGEFEIDHSWEWKGNQPSCYTWVSLATNLSHNFLHVFRVLLDDHVQLLMAMPAPNNENSSSSMMLRLGRWSAWQGFLWFLSSFTASSAVHLQNCNTFNSDNEHKFF